MLGKDVGLQRGFKRHKRNHHMGWFVCKWWWGRKPRDLVSDTEEKGGPGKGCCGFSRKAVPQSEGNSLEEIVVGMKTGKVQRLSASWKSSDPGGAG